MFISHFTNLFTSTANGKQVTLNNCRRHQNLWSMGQITHTQGNFPFSKPFGKVVVLWILVLYVDCDYRSFPVKVGNNLLVVGSEFSSKYIYTRYLILPTLVDFITWSYLTPRSRHKTPWLSTFIIKLWSYSTSRSRHKAPQSSAVIVKFWSHSTSKFWCKEPRLIEVVIKSWSCSTSWSQR